MNFKTFTSDDKHFTILLPIDWEEYDDETNTYTFFNAKAWTGNLRITSFRKTKSQVVHVDDATTILSDELAENKGAIKIKLNEFDCVHYKRDINQDDKHLLIYYWMIGKENDVFACSFTINKEQEKTKQNEEELQTVQNILKSIEIKNND